MTSAPDPVLARRARIARWVAIGQRTGYGLLGVAVAAFVVGLVAGFGTAVTAVVAVAMAGTTVVLAPAIVFGYAVRAAERDDRKAGRPTS